MTLRGVAITLKCSECRTANNRRRSFRDTRRDERFGVQATGRTVRRASYGRRHNVTLYEVEHTCGHRWFSNHPDAARSYRRRFGK